MKRYLFTSVLLVLLQCNNTPVISQLTNDRIKVILKGTYATNNPFDIQSSLPNDDSIGTAGNPCTTSTQVSGSNLKLYLDIGEIRLATGTGQNGANPRDYWSYFSTDREVLCSTVTSNDGSLLDDCNSNDGVTRMSSFLNDGIQIDAVDVASGTYPNIGVYFRKFVTSDATSYDSSCNATTRTTSFDNVTVNGEELVNYYSLSTTDDSNANSRMFPLQRTDLGLQIPGGDKKFTLEIRVPIKTILNKQIVELTSSSTEQYRTFVGPADWAIENQYNSSTIAGRFGGNMTLGARVYQSDDVGTITVNAAAGGTCTANAHYHALVTSGSSLSLTSSSDSVSPLPYAAIRGDQSGTFTNIPSGTYDLYAIDDNTSSDGWPDAASASCSTITVTANSSTTVSPCNCP